MFKKILFLITISLFLSSCGNSDSNSKFAGVWLDTNNLRNGLLVIEETGNNLLINIDNKKYVGIVENDVLKISVNGLSINAITDEANNLILDGKTSVKIAEDMESLLKPKIIGNQTWSSSEINISLNNSNEEYVLPNGQRIYSKKGAENIARIFKGWDLPTTDQATNYFMSVNENSQQIIDDLKLEQHYGAEESPGQVNTNSNYCAFWLKDNTYITDFVNYNGKSVLNPTFIRIKGDQVRVKNEYYDKKYMSIRLVKE